ncbi:MAG TPA: helix-turn-helix transcriptional regulator [Longimicrobium sp.]|jgi:transcriptional regulator with XRE-family HTH domain
MTAPPAGHPLVSLLLQSRATPEFFRRYLADAVASRRISRKGLGEQIGISRQAVADFLTGREPTAETLRKMRGWLVSDALEREDDGPPEAYLVAAGILLRDCRGEDAAQALSEVLEVVERAAERAGEPVPEWIAEVRREAGIGGEGPPLRRRARGRGPAA